MRTPARISICLAALVCCAGAADFGSLQPQGYVSDFARVLRPQTKAALESYCARVQQATGAQIALVTLPSLDGEPIEDVANLLYRRWGVGDKQNHEGVLVLLAIRDRRSRVEVGYGLEPYIPDGFAGSVLRSMRPALGQGDYDLALSEAAQVLGEAIAKAKGVAIGEAQPGRRQPPPQQSAPLSPLLVALLVMAMIVMFGGRRGPRRGGPQHFLFGMLLGHLMGRGGYSRGGGGFGGYDSWDRFGGFGGGDSGGGGASSRW